MIYNTCIYHAYSGRYLRLNIENRNISTFQKTAVNCTNIMSLATYLIYKDTEMKFHTRIEYSMPYKVNIKLDVYRAESQSAQMSKITNDD